MQCEVFVKTNNKNPSVIQVSNKIIDHCVEIEKYFKSKNTKVTIVVRPSDNPQEELVIGNDDWDEVKKAIERTQERTESGKVYG